MYTYRDIFENKSTILFVTAHPDDLEVFFGGIVKLLTRDNKSVHILTVTSGARGSRDKQISEEELAATRFAEQTNALEALGVDGSHYYNLMHRDGDIDNSMGLIGEIAEIMRRVKPEIVCTHEPDGYYMESEQSGYYYVNHRDHRVTGSATLDAVYPFARDRSFFPEQNGSHTVMEVFFTGEKGSNTEIDISSVVADKKAALLAHKSQFDPETVEMLSTPNSESKYLETGKYIKLAW